MKLVFDIGYNHGEFSIACTHKHRNCKIIALEANPVLVQKGPVLKNITLLNNLVSNKVGEKIPFYISPEDGISTASTDFMKNSRFTKGSKYLNIKSKWGAPIDVESTTLDELIKTYGSPDFIKVDVEGYEQEVISGLSAPIPLIGFEWHEEDFDSVVEIVNHLSKIGFTEFGVVGYFEGDIPKEVTFSERGDPYMDFPKNFYSWDVLNKALNKLVDRSRLVHYGMFYGKK